MQNFLEETREAIAGSGHSISELYFIGSRDGHQCTWREFEKLANFYYDAGFGSSAIATDLILVFSDGVVMVRGEYDGSEWWEYNAPFVMPTETLPITSVGGDAYMWSTLTDIEKGL